MTGHRPFKELTASFSQARMVRVALMKDEYDFSIAERGTFFREGARLVPPVETQALRYLLALAAAQGVSLSSLTNILLNEYIKQTDAID